MRRVCAVLLLVATVLPASSPCTATAQDPANGPAWQPFETAVTAAKKSGKKILVDVYAPWCGWCRKLQREVYTDTTIQTYLTEHFELARLNGDDSEEMVRFRDQRLSALQLAQGLGAEGFPTTVFLSSESAYITRLPGFIDAKAFLQVLRFIATDAYLEQTYQEFVEREY